MKTPRTLSPAAALALLKPGMRVFVHAGPSECMTFVEALKADPERARGVEFVGVFIPGLNTTDYSALAPDARIASTFVSPPFAEAFSSGRLRYLPKAYSGFAATLARMQIDIAILRVSPPGPDGRMSYGLNQDYAPIAAATARRVIAFVDQNMPYVTGEPGLRAKDCDAIVEIDEPLRPFPAATASGVLEKVGINAAQLIRDGDTIQIGIGKVQSAVLANLFDRKHLGLHSGMIDDAIAALMDKGVLDNSAKSADRGVGVTGMAIGTQATWACAQRPDMRFRSANYTHSASVIAAQDNFVAINSAIEVDLLGQCNAEMLGGRQISGAGGFHDFQRGAAGSNGGRAIVALPSSAGGASRIVARLPAGVATGPRNDADYIVTEYGMAALRDLDLDRRAEALIMVAAPQFRSELTDAWKDLRAKF
ncbi:MAG: acetyl-CoA hydrolase/transferase family protein [Rhodoblastus sp.]|nr:acetyl-CoA hydrolase/transferase family protein [Rhodoblastus sp.]